MNISEMNQWLIMLTIGVVMFLYCFCNFIKYKDKDGTDPQLAIMICVGMFGSAILLISCVVHIIQI
jgi:hypothetical protein